jgi:hydrogenase small subunit
MTYANSELTVGEILLKHGISRRSFIKFCTATASAMALPPWMGPAMAEQLRNAPRPSVVYLSFQECTGCLETLTRSFAPTIEDLIFNIISFDYNDTLMVASGEAADSARDKAMKDNFGKYVLVIDGSVPTGAGGAYCTAGGHCARAPCAKRPRCGCHCLRRNLRGLWRHSIRRSQPHQRLAVSAIVGDKPIINVSGCPPIPEVITGTLLQFVATGRVPDLDEHRRPKAYFGNTIHDRCYRRPFMTR